MALIFLGTTKCALCGQTLMEEDDVTGLPAIADKSHPLYEYFDCGFHLTCFDNWDKKEEALKTFEDEIQKSKL